MRIDAVVSAEAARFQLCCKTKNVNEDGRGGGGNSKVSIDDTCATVSSPVQQGKAARHPQARRAIVPRPEKKENTGTPPMAPCVYFFATIYAWRRQTFRSYACSARLKWLGAWQLTPLLAGIVSGGRMNTSKQARCQVLWDLRKGTVCFTRASNCARESIGCHTKTHSYRDVRS